VVGENYFRNESTGGDFGDVFRMDENTTRHVLARLREIKQSRDAAKVTQSLDRLEAAAQDLKENVMPYLVDCCHAYATVSEMIARLKRHWGEFREPIRL